MTRRPDPRRPVPKDFLDFMVDRQLSHPASKGENPESIINELLYTERGINIMQGWWDREVDYQEQNECPPWCTAFEKHKHPELR